MEKVEQPTVDHYGYAELYIYMSGIVETSEEYLLFDANAIVASVGGSLGLFLGVSCINLFNVILEKMFH